jgi:cysteine synthase A
MIHESMTELIGGTPLLELKNFEGAHGLNARIVAKLEFFNPAGSAKDRIGLHMIEDAERRGTLRPGATIIEPTSGNTGIGIAAVAAARGYRTVFTMPETMSVERRRLLAVYGAEIVLTPAAEGMQGAVDAATRLAAEREGAVILGQFDNPANPESHYLTTGPEIWRDTDGKVDVLVAGIGTGGTLSGTGKYLLEQNPDILVVGVEPETSPLLTKGFAGAHEIQGIGANFVPKALDRRVCGEVIDAPNDVGFAYARELARSEGVLTGISSGAALWAAEQVAKRPESAGKLIVVILPDTGERYMSTKIFA